MDLMFLDLVRSLGVDPFKNGLPFFDLLVDPWNNFLVVQTKANDDLGLYQV